MQGFIINRVHYNGFEFMQFFVQFYDINFIFSFCLKVEKSELKLAQKLIVRRTW